MNTKSDCWLCGRGTGVDNGGLKPGELEPNVWGDLVCWECTDKINLTVKVMENPKLGELMIAMESLPKVEGVTMGLKFESEKE